MYLKGKSHLGLKFLPDPSKEFDCYADADFYGAWNKRRARADPSTAKSRSGWIIFYVTVPICWASKLQTQVALTTTKAEYIALLSTLRDVIPIMQLIEEVKSNGFKVISAAPFVYCCAFEDNAGALELACLPKLCPCTKHINVCYHHFREFVRKGLIKIFPITSKKQIADMTTKALAQNDFVLYHSTTCGQ